MHEEPEAKFESSSKQSCRASGDETETFSMLISRIPRVNALPAEVGLHVSESSLWFKAKHWDWENIIDNKCS